MNTPAIILAGGLGTRLRSAVDDVPKPLALVNNKPFLCYLLQHLEKEDVTHVILSVGYKYEKIQDIIGNKFGKIDIEYSVESTPLGTGGALSLAVKNIQEDFYLLNGDTLAQLSLSKLRQFHYKENSSITLSLKELTRQNRYGTVVLTEQCHVAQFIPKQSDNASGLINTGTYFISRSAAESLPKTTLPFSFENYLEQSVNSISILGLINTDYFIDIGIPEDYYQAQTDFKKLFESC